MQTLDPEITPEWFIDIFLEATSKINKNPERFLKAGSFVCIDREYLTEGIVNLYGILLSDSNVIYIGRKYQPQKEENQIEYYKFMIPFKPAESTQ